MLRPFKKNPTPIFITLTRQCLNRRTPTMAQLEQETLDLVEERSSKKIKIDWQFSIQSARTKLNSSYVTVHDDNEKFKIHNSHCTKYMVTNSLHYDLELQYIT